MSGYLSIFQSILSTKGPFLDFYLDGLDEHKKFGAKNNDEASLVQHISSLLTTSTTRVLGLRVLDKFLDNCSADALEKKGNLWIKLVIKACNNQELQCDASLTFHVLDKMMKRSQQVPDLSKSFINTHISKLYESLTNIPFSKTKHALICIETCLRIYPASSSPSRSIIERFLWNNIDHIDYEVVKNCGRCLHLLQQVKGGGVQGVNIKTQWKNYQIQLLSGVHSVFNEMFANCVELYEDKIEQEKVPWEKNLIVFDPEPVKKAAQMYTRCRNLITYLIIALREHFPVEKPILIKKILNTAVRGLSVNCLTLERNPIADNIALSLLLPKLHAELWNLLNVAISLLRGHLRPYSELILGLMVDALKWTSDKNVHEDCKTFLSLRKKVYDTVSLWSKVYNSGNRCETIAEDLFQEILSDITPIQTEFTLKVLSGARKHMSKKAKRQLHNIQNEKSSMAKTHSSGRNEKHFLENRNQELCISALRCLQEIIFSVGNFVKPTILKRMQTNITQISAIFYELPPKPDHLYSNRICRIEIYNALYALLLVTHHLCPPPTELILAIIQSGNVRDDSLEVRIRCDFILKNLEKIIHPQKESLLFTTEPRDIRNAFIKMGQENLLREFEFDLSYSLSHNITNNDVNVSESCTSRNDQITNTPLNKDENDVMEYNNKTHDIDVAVVVDVVEPLNDEINDVIEMEANKNQVFIEDAALHGETYNTIKNIDNLVVVPSDFEKQNDDEEEPNIIAAVNEKEENVTNDCIIGDPLTKKQRLDNVHRETDQLKHLNVTDKLDYDEDNMLDEIASQFIDELE